MLINNQPGQRGLTEEGKDAFKLAYNSTCTFESEYKPIIRFPREAAEIVRQVSELRKKDWKTTTRWNSEADYTGLLGELAAQRYLGISTDQALEDYIKGLNGDAGHDVVANGLKLDAKATKGDALKFKFNKNNRYTALADGFIFTYVETSGAEIWIHLLGWCHRADVKPYLRDDGQRYFVRVETLRREGVLKPVSQLKQPTEQVQTVTNPITNH
jgi:hypothetical protein